MMHRYIASLACLLLLGVQAPQAITLGAVARVSTAGNGEDVQQVWAAADPSDARHLIVCGYDQYSRQNVSTGYVYSSADGGASWRRTMLDNGTKFVSEENCTYDKNGRAYFAAGESDTSTGEPRHEWGHLNIFGSDDHGMHWNKLWTRKDGWIDWTYLAAEPAGKGFPSSVVVFGNSGTDRLGHWWASRPVAIASHDNGRTFSNLLAPRPPAGLKYVAVWTSGDATLADGTALFSTSASLAPPKQKGYGWANTGHLNVEIFAYSPSTNTVSSRAVIRSVSPAVVFTITMAQDASHGRFAGRLYTAWLESSPKNDSTGRLWLTTSGDRGFHWSTRPVSPSGCVGDLKIATAPNGTLGLVWADDSKEIHFAASRDGGRTFSAPTTVVVHDPGALATTDAVTFNEWWAAEVIANKARKSLMPYLDDKHLGVSIRMGQPRGIHDYGLVADANGAFHPLWSQVEPDGTHALFTRTVRIAAKNSSAGSMLPGGPAQCAAANVAQEHVPLPGPRPNVHPAGQHEVSDSFVLHIQNLHYDGASHSVSADVIATPKENAVIRGPLSLFGLGLHSDYGTIIARNAAGNVDGQPFWNISLGKPTPLRFQITKFRMLPDSEDGGDASAMWVSIYEKS